MDGAPRPLSDLLPMQIAIIEQVDGQDAAANRLKALGLCIGRRVQVVKTGDPLILRVLGSRLGLSRRLAQRVLARPCHPGHTHLLDVDPHSHHARDAGMPP